MNGTEDSITTCHYFSTTTTHVSSFKSNKYATIRISNIAFLAVLILRMVLLNVTTIITIWKSPSLKKKLSCFVIFLISLVDLIVGCVCIPIVLYFLLAPFADADICIAFIFVSRTTGLTTGLSIVTLCALTTERYLGIVHPYCHRTDVTKERVLTCVLVGVLTVLSIIVASFFTRVKIIKLGGVVGLVLFLAVNIIAYTKIYHVARK